MKGFEIMKLRERNRIFVMAILLSICVFLTFYFHTVLAIGTVFTHFFYIPIIIASIWWKRKGIIVALFLSVLLVLSHIFIRGNVSTIDDFLRAPMFIVVSLVTAVLSERIAKGQKALQESHDKLEQRVIERTSKLKLANEQLEGEVNEHKQAEKALRESEEKFRAFVDTASDLMFISDKDGNFTDVNEAMIKILGYSRVELIGMHITQLFSEKALENDFKPNWEKFIEAGKINIDTTFATKDGKEIHGELKAIAIYDNYGKYAGSRAVFYDITERKKAEEALLDSEERFRTIFNSINDAVFVQDSETGAILDVNSTMCEMYGYSRKKVLQLKNQDLSLGQSPYSQKEALEWMRKAVAGNPQVFEWMAKHKSGRLFWVEVNIKKAIIGIQYRLLIVVRDITKRKKAEEELRKLNDELIMKNKELEQVVFVASHDLRSPLVNIRGFSSELELSIKELITKLQDEGTTNEVKEKIAPMLEEDIPEALQFILKSSSKMDTLLTGLLKISRLGRAELTIVKIDMNELISDVIKARAFQIKDLGVKLDVSDLLPCIGDRKQIDQLFSNLLDNALKYLDPNRSGIIKISGYREKKNTIYCIEDNGIGIAQEHQKKIFEIFHQLDPETSTGEGLGLNIAKKIVEKHLGKIWLESEYGKGSKFYVAIPMK